MDSQLVTNQPCFPDQDDVAASPGGPNTRRDIPGRHRGEQPAPRRRDADGIASALAGPVALAGAFGTFGTAMWTNIHVDGNPEASTLATMLAVAPIAGLFLAPSVVLVAVARHARLRGAQRVFAIVGVRSLALFTLGYGLAPILALSILWVATHIAVRRKLSVPPFDLILVASHWTLFAFFAYVESHR